MCIFQIRLGGNQGFQLGYSIFQSIVFREGFFDLRSRGLDVFQTSKQDVGRLVMLGNYAGQSYGAGQRSTQEKTKDSGS